MSAIMAILITLVSMIGGETYSTDDIIYSVDSLIRTGVILEDSIFWDCATMGNGICG